MCEIQYCHTHDSRVRMWQPGWAPDSFEVMSFSDFQKFIELSRLFHILFVDKTYENED